MPDRWAAGGQCCTHIIERERVSPMHHLTHLHSKCIIGCVVLCALCSCVINGCSDQSRTTTPLPTDVVRQQTIDFASAPTPLVARATLPTAASASPSIRLSKAPTTQTYDDPNAPIPAQTRAAMLATDIAQLPGTLTEKDTGRRLAIVVTARFMVVLDERIYPRQQLVCTPEGIIGGVSNIPA